MKNNIVNAHLDQTFSCFLIGQMREECSLRTANDVPRKCHSYMGERKSAEKKNHNEKLRACLQKFSNTVFENSS